MNVELFIGKYYARCLHCVFDCVVFLHTQIVSSQSADGSILVLGNVSRKFAVSSVDVEASFPTTQIQPASKNQLQRVDLKTVLWLLSNITVVPSEIVFLYVVGFIDLSNFFLCQSKNAKPSLSSRGRWSWSSKSIASLSSWQ